MALIEMRAFFSFLLAVLVILTPRIAKSEAREPATFKIVDDPFFSQYERPLVDYLRSRHVTRDSKVCILGEEDADGSKWAWIIWPRGHQMILWEDSSEPLIHSRRILDLRTDVVASEDELHGSTYMVTRDWVSGETARCDRDGLTIEISSRALKSK
jgi:hypothetical protein